MPEYPVLIGLAGKMSNFLSSLTDFIEIRRVLASSTSATLKLLKFIFTVSDLIMPKPVFLMTVHEAHKEYNSSIDQIRARYELLDSGECGSVGTPAFDAECFELAHLMACMSELCKHLNLPMPKELHRPPHFKHCSALNSKLFVAGSVRVWRMQLCHSFVRITGLLSTPIAFKNWGLAVRLACNHPCSLTSPRTFKYKAASSDCMVVNR